MDNQNNNENNGYSPDNNNPYNNLPPNTTIIRLNGFSVAAIILAGVSILTFMTIIIPIFTGSLAVLFAILSKGKDLKMNRIAKRAAIFGAAAACGAVLSFGVNYYKIMTDPDLREQYQTELNSTFERMYGISYDEMMQQILGGTNTPENTPAIGSDTTLPPGKGGDLSPDSTTPETLTDGRNITL